MPGTGQGAQSVSRPLFQPGDKAAASEAIWRQREAGVILRKYGTKVQSVEPNFDSRAMNEVGFQRTEALVLNADEFDSKYERLNAVELTAHAEGSVQDETEKALLAALREQLEKIQSELGNGQVLLIENEQGKDYPKSREKQSVLVVEGENRLHFERRIEPPLRVAVYAEKKS